MTEAPNSGSTLPLPFWWEAERCLHLSETLLLILASRCVFKAPPLFELERLKPISLGWYRVPHS